MWIFPFNWKLLQLKFKRFLLWKETKPMLFWKGGSLLYKNDVISQSPMQWYTSRLSVFRHNFILNLIRLHKQRRYIQKTLGFINSNTKYYQIFHDIETTNTGIWIRNIVTVLKKINLIYEIQLLSIFKEPWHRNNKYGSLKIIITVFKKIRFGTMWK